MKSLLLALFLFASSGMNAALAPNSVMLLNFNGDLSDASDNAYNGVEFGTVPFVSSPAPPVDGTQSAGPFTDINYVVAPAGATGDMASPAAGTTIEVYFYTTSLATIQYFHAQTVSGFGQHSRINTNGSVCWQWGGTSMCTPASTISINTWYHLAVVNNSGSGNSELFVSIATSISDTPDAQFNYNTSITTWTNSFIGRGDIAARQFNGFLSKFRYSNVKRTDFPTDQFDTVDTGPFIRNTEYIIPSEYLPVTDFLRLE